jgi:hypothetical protein
MGGIAVIGVSANVAKFGFRIFRDLVAAGGEIYGIHPAGGTALGRKLYRNLAEIKDKPELVITVAPPEVTEKTVEDCICLGIKAIWMQPGSESQAAIDKARAAGIAVTANACYMIVKGHW